MSKASPRMPTEPKAAAPRIVGAPTAISADLLAPPPRRMTVLMQTLIGLLAAALLWSMMAVLQEVTSAEGRVVPASKIQLVQNLEGGIVREVVVREGALVKEGDVVVRIDPTQAGSSLGEAREKLAGLDILIARLQAEIEGRPFVVPEALKAHRPDQVSRELELYDARKAAVQSTVSTLDLQARQKAQEVVELEAKLVTLKKALALAQEEWKLIQPLAQSKAASRSELLAIETKLNDTEGAVTASELALPRLRDAIKEAKDRREEKLSTFRSEALQQLSSAQIERAALDQASKSSVDKLARTTVRAPVAGVVKTVHVTTPGQVVQPGSDLVEIVPMNDTLLVEARVRPQDIAFVRPGQEALVKLTAYDFSIYGGFKGTVEQIGADSITTEKGETYYLIRVKTERSTLSHKGQPLPVIPGMVANVDVITGAKTVFAYLMKPMTRLRHEAMRER
jgi:membrane fusion protein, adhesin transport system